MVGWGSLQHGNALVSPYIGGMEQGIALDEFAKISLLSPHVHEVLGMFLTWWIRGTLC